MFENSNYALVAAIVQNKNCKCLYSDIYFPIIKYSVRQVLMTKNQILGYCEAEEVYEYILSNFKFPIPHIVIAQSIKKIANTSHDFEIEVFDNGNSYRIKSVNYELNEDEIKTKEESLNKGLKEIEDLYRLFITKEGLYDDGVSFLSFITDNTEEILGFFEDDNSDRVGEKYISVIKFLQYLSDNKRDLFENANLLFWSSIIVGFLRSEKPQISENDNSQKTEFFLDTPVVLGLLNLSNKNRENSAKDVCSIIKSSSGILRVHPLTLEEVKSILESVKNNGPYAGTDIESAYERYDYDCVKIGEIQVHLIEKLDELGVSLFPNAMSISELKKIEDKFKNSLITKQLALSRSSLNDYELAKSNFREVHDCFMDDFIAKQRQSKGENVYFLTANNDLVSFFKTVHPDKNNMMTIGRAILNLWMHNSKPMDVTGSLLTELMAHCLEVHKTSVRGKIKVVSSFFNKYKNHFDEKVYSDFLRHLYRRGKYTIMTEDYVLGEKTFNDDVAEIIRKAVNDDNSTYDERTAENVRLAEENKQKEDSLNDQKSENKQLQTELSEKKERIDSLEKDNKKIEDQRREKEEENRRLKELQQKKDGLYKEKDILNSEILDLEKTLISLGEVRGKAYINYEKIFCYSVAIIVVPIITLVLLYYFHDKIDNMPKCLGSVFSPFAIIGLLLRQAHQAKKNEKDSMDKFYGKWDVKNPTYNAKKQDLKFRNERISIINKELENLNK